MGCSRKSVRGCALVACGIVLTTVDARIAFAQKQGELLKAAEEARAVSVEALRREVQVQLDDARQSMARDPGQVIKSLKQLHDRVLGSPDLSAADRTTLRSQIAGALREASRRAVERQATDQERFAAKASARERQHVLSQFDRREMRLDQLADRINGLLNEQRYELAEDVAATAAEDAGHSPVAASLPLNARTRQYAHDAATKRVSRQKGVVATLASVETTHMPQSDEPPIVYMDAAKWQELTRKRGKYSTDMYEEKPAEAKIRKSLDETTSLEFVETPLGDVIDYLKDLHNIEVQLDTKALDEIDAGSDTPLTIQLRGISLRSALRLLLRQLDLTYTIQDEVLLITTPDVAATMMVPHVYKVADIVLPIQSTNFSGGFGPLGGSSNGNMFGMNQGQNGPNNQGPFNVNPLNNQRNGNPLRQDANNMF